MAKLGLGLQKPPLEVDQSNQKYKLVGNMKVVEMT